MFVLSVIDGAALRIDDKLRVAKERREEQEKQQGKKDLTNTINFLIYTHIVVINTHLLTRISCDLFSIARVPDPGARAQGPATAGATDGRETEEAG